MATKVQQSKRKYITLANRLERLVDAGELQAGEALPSIRDLMASDGVSMATVVKGLDVLEKRGIIRRMPQRGFFINDRDRPDSDLRQIIFITHGLVGETNQYAQGLAKALDIDSSITLSTFATHGELDRFHNILDKACRLRPAGIALMGLPFEVDTDVFEGLEQSGIPVVVIGHISCLNCDGVDYRISDSGRKLTRHLLERGADDFALLLLEPQEFLENKLLITSVRNELNEAGLDLPEERCYYFNAPHGYTFPADPFIDAQETIRELLRKGEQFRTLICAHDYAAVSAIRVVQEFGLRIPEDIRIASAVGCHINGVSPMKLTTVDVNRCEQGKIAGELLLRRMKGSDGNSEIHYVAGDLIVGETT